MAYRTHVTLQGKDLKAVPSAPEQPGPWTGRVLAHVMEWQLEYPSGTKEECIAWVDEQLRERLVNTSPDASANRKRVEERGVNATKKIKR